MQLRTGDSHLYVRDGIINIPAHSPNIISISSFVGMSVG